MYIVKLNNTEIFKNNIITFCVNICLSHIGNSFKEFNKNNSIHIYKDFTIEDMPELIKAHYILSSGDENKIYQDYYELLKEIA